MIYMTQCVNICVYAYTGIYTEKVSLYELEIFIKTFLSAYIEAFYRYSIFFK